MQGGVVASQHSGGTVAIKRTVRPPGEMYGRLQVRGVEVISMNGGSHSTLPSSWTSQDPPLTSSE